MGDNDITAVWGILKDLTVLFENTVQTNLSGGAVLPVAEGRQVPASELAWPEGEEHHVSASTNHWFMGEVTLHVRWKAGGTYQGKGLFVQNASMTVTGEVTHGATVKVTGQWLEQSYNGPPKNAMGYLRGNISVEMSTSVPFTTRHLDGFTIFVRGDGAGQITQEA